MNVTRGKQVVHAFKHLYPGNKMALLHDKKIVLPYTVDNIMKISYKKQ